MTRVVIVGGGSHGMPLILNTDDSNSLRPSPPIPAEPADPAAKVQNSDAESSGKLAGSIDMAPPQTNSPFDQLARPDAAAMQQQQDDAKAVAASQSLDADPSGDAPPYILRSFADAFGYRLQPRTSPPSASITAPNERPR